MAERQSKGFYQDIESHETFQVGDKDEKRGNIVMDIGMADDKNLKKIFLSKSKLSNRMTGNALVDAYNKVNDFLIDHTKISVREMATTFRLMAVMINAGMPLIKSLNTLAVQAEKQPKLAKTLFKLAEYVENGSSLSIAMENFPEVFAESQIGAVQAGEASGQLNKTLKDLASELEKTASISGKVKGALIYPVAILCLMVAVIFVMMVAVIPQMSELFGNSGRALPLPTQILINLSDFTLSYWYVIISVSVLLVFGLIFWKKTKSGKYYWDLFLIKLPIFGNLVRKSILAKFAHSFGNLLSSGVPIIKAIEICSTAVGNEVYRRRLLLTAEDMKAGIPMAENMSNSKLFPNILVNMIEVGEQTAQLENIMAKVAKFFDEEVDTSVSALTKVMEPLIIVVVGATVGGLVAAVMLPIFQLTDLTTTA
ncbi:MAG: type II secretion system F family protein [Candidatus Altimarinota bacterium]